MTINELILRGSRAINVRPEIITSPTRKQNIVLTRHAIASIAYNQGYKYREIAAALHRVQHGTIINGCRCTENLLKYNRDFRALYNLLKTAQHVLPDTV